MVTGLVPRACTCRRPARSGGVEEKGRRSVPLAQSRDRGLTVPAPGSPSIVVDGNRAQDAPTCGPEAHSRAEVKPKSKEDREGEASPEEESEPQPSEEERTASRRRE